MAIGYRSGYLRKKIGDMVMFVNQNVSGKVKQVARAYTAEVANPKTARQSNQRSLFVAAKNFRRGFEGLLNHSWQGKKYGVQSLNKFSSLVLANKGANYPGFFLQPKNSQKFIPQPWPLSTGSIQGVAAPFFDYSDGVRAILGLSFASGFSGSTMGEFSQALIAANPGLKDGDMITICAVGCADSTILTTSVFLPVYDRFILDVNSTEELESDGETLWTQNRAFWIDIADYDNINGFEIGWPGSTHSIVGIGVIVSRLSETGKTWERSTSIMVVRSDVEDVFNNTEYVNNCIATFMDESMLTSDWYLNQVGQDTVNPGGGGGGGANSYQEGSVTLANSQTIANALIATIGGVRKPVAGVSGSTKACVVKSGGAWQYNMAQNVLAAATDVFTVAEFNAAFPEVTITLVENP